MLVIQGSRSGGSRRGAERARSKQTDLHLMSITSVGVVDEKPDFGIAPFSSIPY